MDVTVLQAVRLKGGIADAGLIAEATGRSEEEARAALDELLADERIEERNGRYRISGTGRSDLEQELAAERTELDSAAIEALYEAFEPLNTTFKQIAGDWQMRDGQPNDHSDPDYDRAVLERLDALDGERFSLTEQLVAAAPRLAPYRGRFATALERVREGDMRYLLSPVVDSYHQIWFELHEDLIGLAGRDRQQEAAAGRAE